MSVKPDTDNSQDIREMRETCEMRHACTGYFVFLMLLHATDFSCLEQFRGRSGNYVRDKGIFSCNKE